MSGGTSNHFGGFGLMFATFSHALSPTGVVSRKSYLANHPVAFDLPVDDCHWRQRHILNRGAIGTGHLYCVPVQRVGRICRNAFGR